MASGQVHVVGAGLAGIAAAVSLAAAGRRVVVHEAARQAGGRCRSYYDATLGAQIDNGNHLVLSGNHATFAFLATCGNPEALTGPAHAAFDFADLANGERWCVAMNDGVIPWWITDKRRRVPGTRMADYLGIGRMLLAGRDTTIADVMAPSGELWRRLLEPVLVSALNSEPATASAKLAGAVMRETMMRGGRHCRPMVATQGLSAAFIDPAIGYLAGKGADVCFGHRLRALEFEAQRVSALDFGDARITLGPGDALVLGVPAQVAAALVPRLAVPTEFRAIVNGHFAVAPPADQPLILGVVGGTVEWLFAFEGRLSVTVSNADRLCETPREDLARRLWEDVARLTGLTCAMPRWQIVRERRATFAATPAQDRLRPGNRTQWTNLELAGDWTDTGLPSTIEGAIRSGNKAAAALVSRPV